MTAAGGGVRVAVRLTPKARAERIEGVVDGRLRIAVTAPPAENRANDALLRLLSRAWRIPRRDLTITAGGKSRDKVIEITGDPRELLPRLRTMLVSG